MKTKTRTILIRIGFALLLCLGFLTGDQGLRTEGAGIPQGDTIVRVAVGIGQSSALFTVAHGSYTVIHPDQGLQAAGISPGQNVTVIPSGSGLSIAIDGAGLSYSGNRVAFSADGTELDVLLYGARSCRGSFIVENRDGALLVVNALDVDQYLLGVLPMEMGLSTAPAEALMTQAVVSRTYALKKKNSGGSYDLVSGSADQLYGGFGNERAYTSAAVETTKGQAIYYDGQLIDAFFSSNSGGQTEDAENVWNAPLPYARSVTSPHDAFAMQMPQDATGYPGNTYQWQVRFTIRELQNRVAEWNQKNPDNRIQIGNIQGIQGYAYAYDPDSRRIADRINSSGRITRLDLIGDGGTFSLHKENVRSFLGLRSALFTITPEGGVAVRNGAGVTVMLGQSIRDSKGLIPWGQPSEINPGSNSFFVATADGVKEMKKDEASTVTAYIIDGKGYGHGVGLSQWGAIGMANAGMTYGQIIEHYYNQGRNDGRLSIRTIQ